ncbi:hypothetical protein HDU96_003115 [Phlyctochytrium bullatum]|nr:hypothetical protein HDU96_003115 [Phlyctochytrium bullatum]
MQPKDHLALILEVPAKPARPPERYDPLVLRKVPVPEVKPGHVLLRVKAAALNHRDVFIREGLYPGIKNGAILGADGAGVVAALPEDAKGLEVGARVLVNPSCNWKSNMRAPEDPSKYGIMGMLPFPGTFAEHVLVKRDAVHPIPAHLSFEEAAALPLAGLTAWRALFTKGELKKGQNVLITGIGARGGVALFALQFAVAAEANVYVTSSDQAKIDRAVKLGAKGGVNYKSKTWGQELERLAGGPMDVVVDGSGTTENFKAFIKCLRPGGIISNYGATAGVVVDLLLPTMFLKHIEIRGATMGNEVEFAEMVAFVSRTKLKPVVSNVFDFYDFEKAFESMRVGKQFGKLVLRLPEDGSRL